MRINSFEVRSVWKNLDGLKLDFDADREVTVVIGQNGAAKSNLLEAIITVFINIDLNEVSAFAYMMIYTIYGRSVRVVSEQGKHPKSELDGKLVSLAELRASWTPRYVVGYYSGVSDRFEELFLKHDRKALDETLVSTELTSSPQVLNLRRFICARPVHGLFALLAFYFSDDKLVVDFLKRHPRIEGFDSALLVVRKPYWAKKDSKASDFWGAKGPVRDLLERIQKYSLVPFSRTLSGKRDLRRLGKRELLYLYLPDINSLRSLAQEYGREPRALFQALDTMRLSDLIEDFRVRVKVKGSKLPIHTRQLSEGEQQLLTVLGLMRFTRNEASLYILDEPDTHLNPMWGVDYLQHLRRIGGIHRDSHTILATHHPLLVAGLLREEIRVLSRSAGGQIRAFIPEESPRGMGVAGVLTSPLYGLPSQLDSFSLKVLKRIYEISVLDSNEHRVRHIRRLRSLVPAVEMANGSPDPYRDIARDAYQLSLEKIVSSDESIDKKVLAVERLASMLYTRSFIGDGQ